MKNYLINLMEQVNTNVFLQGSLNSDEEYKDSFLTFWNFETPEGQFYDNDPNRAMWGFWVYAYANDPEVLDSMMESLIDTFKRDEKIILSGKGEDVASDVNTHTGRMLTVYLIENYEPNGEV